MIRHLLCFLLFALLALPAAPAQADNFSPAYLQLNEREGGIYDLRWKTPAQSETTVLPIRPVYPPGSALVRPLSSSFASGSAVMVGQLRVPGGIDGKTIRFEGLAKTGNQALVRIVRTDGSEELYKASASEPQVHFPREPGAMNVSARYTWLGIEHILIGFDHLLFVAALFMLVAGFRALFWTVTSFTIAHSITLALVTLDVIRVPVPPVEAFIALSIVFVAVEVVRAGQGRPSLASRKPWLVAFTFGLLHGLGFASALAEIGVPRGNVPLALLFFNVGVEVGQLAFVATVLALAALARRLAQPPQLAMARLASCYVIGGLASYWLFDRVAAFG